MAGGVAEGGGAPNAMDLDLTERFCLMLYTTPAGEDGIKFYEIINNRSRIQELGIWDFGHYRNFLREAVQKLSQLHSPLVYRGGSEARRDVWEDAEVGDGDTVVFRSLITSFSSDPSSSVGFITDEGIWYQVTPHDDTNLRWLNGEYSWYGTDEAEAILFADASTFHVDATTWMDTFQGCDGILIVEMTELPGAPERDDNGELDDDDIGSLGG